jgi:hypothetical protein
MCKENLLPLPDRYILLGVVEQMLCEIARELPRGEQPRKDDLLAMLSAGERKLNLFFIKLLTREEVTTLRRDSAWRGKLYSALRGAIVSLKAPLLSPQTVRRLVPEASGWPMAEVRTDPDLWAARIIATLPHKPDKPLPLVSLRELISALLPMMEARLPQLESIELLDTLYVYIERELASTPQVDRFVLRALELFGRESEEPGEVIAAYRLLAMRVPDTLERLEPSAEKDKRLVAIKEAVGFQSPDKLRFEFKKRTMARGDELMKAAGNFEELLELRFFFDQIGERSNKGLLSRKAGELARGMNVRAQGYELLGKLCMEELDEDGLLELVPAMMGKAESFVLGAPRKFLRRLMKFYLETAVPLLRSLKSKPEKVPRLIQNFKRQVGLLNNYGGLDDLVLTIQRKMVLAICGPQMLAEAPDRILSYLTHLPPEFYPPEVMNVIREMVRERGEGYCFTTGDVLCILGAYPPAEDEEEEDVQGGSSAEDIEQLIRHKQGKSSE